MAGKIVPVGVQRIQGGVSGTFDLVRDNKPTVTFTLMFAPDASPSDIAKALQAECTKIAEQEPPPALRTIEAAMAAGNVWNLPDEEPGA